MTRRQQGERGVADQAGSLVRSSAGRRAAARVGDAARTTTPEWSHQPATTTAPMTDLAASLTRRPARGPRSHRRRQDDAADQAASATWAGAAIATDQDPHRLRSLERRQDQWPVQAARTAGLARLVRSRDPDAITCSTGETCSTRRRTGDSWFGPGGTDRTQSAADPVRFADDTMSPSSRAASSTRSHSRPSRISNGTRSRLIFEVLPAAAAANLEPRSAKDEGTMQASSKSVLGVDPPSDGHIARRTGRERDGLRDRDSRRRRKKAADPVVEPKVRNTSTPTAIAARPAITGTMATRRR